MKEHPPAPESRPSDRYLAIPQVSIDTLRFVFKLSEQAHELQLSIKDQVERKATNMLGFGGLIAAWETQMLSGLAGHTAPADKSMILAFVIAVTLTIVSCLCSFLALRVWGYASPDVNSLCDFEEMRRDEATVMGKATNALLQATQENTLTNQRKVRLLQTAYVLFVINVILLISVFAWVWSRRILEMD